jgi:hypothetical protein
MLADIENGDDGDTEDSDEGSRTTEPPNVQRVADEETKKGSLAERDRGANVQTCKVHRPRIGALRAPREVAEPSAGVKRRSAGPFEHEACRRRLTPSRRAQLDGNEVVRDWAAHDRCARLEPGRFARAAVQQLGERDRELPRRGAELEPQPARPGRGPERVDRVGERRSGRSTVREPSVGRVRPEPRRAADGLGSAGGRAQPAAHRPRRTPEAS